VGVLVGVGVTTAIGSGVGLSVVGIGGGRCVGEETVGKGEEAAVGAQAAVTIRSRRAR